jgi:hypothetical protein
MALVRQDVAAFTDAVEAGGVEEGPWTVFSKPQVS